MNKRNRGNGAGRLSDKKNITKTRRNEITKAFHHKGHKEKEHGDFYKVILCVLCGFIIFNLREIDQLSTSNK